MGKTFAAKASHLALVGCKYLGVPYKTMDCQAFMERCLKDCGISKDLPGSNSWYREFKKNGWVGTPEECKKTFGIIPVGAFLFIWKTDGKEPEQFKNDGIGNMSHIGIYTNMTGEQMVEMAKADGDTHDPAKWNKGDGAINSSSTHEHVATSKFKGKSIRNGWNRVGLWNRIDYGEAINARLGTAMDPQADSAPAAQETAVARGVIFSETGTTVKLRARPSTGCALYWNIPIGDEVEVYATGDWDRVRWNGRTGYVKSEYVRIGETMVIIEPDPEKVPKLATVWADHGNTVKMRYKPSLDCNLYEKVPIGSTVAVNKAGEKWSQISFGSRAGWYMMTAFLKFAEE